MVQTVVAYLIVAAAAAWSLRGLWPKRAKPKSSGTCDNCDCGQKS